MRAILNNDYYSSKDIWQKEKHFSQLWQFAAFKQELSKKNDFICINIFGKSVFIQNTGEGIEAFSNICPHRSSRLKLQRKGNSAIICPYHSWSFKAGGHLHRIPNENDFSLSKCEKNNIKLDKWFIEECGNLIFVRESDSGPSLKKTLGGYYNKLAVFSQSLGLRVDENILTIDANWKIVVENTLESYHVNSVHPTSFARLGAKSALFNFTEENSSWVADFNEKTAKSALLLNKHLDKRPYQTQGYEHFFVFPMLTIATSFGTSFSFQEFRPISHNKTQFISHVFLTKFENSSKIIDSILPSFSKSIVDFNRQVFNEDAEICEAVHKGCFEKKNYYGYISQLESRVTHFQKSYENFIKGL